VHVKSDGTPWRPIVHVEDIVRAFLSVLAAPRELIHNEVFNVGVTAENYRIRELADIVQQTVPGCRVEYASGGGPDKRCYRVNCKKIHRTLPSFQPRWDARKGARQLYEAYRAAGLEAEDLRNHRYTRIAHIRRLLNRGLLDRSLRWSAAEGAAPEAGVVHHTAAH
jgi:nucleoside-diphosphate-sugar epimerase